MDSSDANEAKVFALAIGCCELLRTGGLNAILEGDSIPAIHWGSGKGNSSLKVAILGGGGVGYFKPVGWCFVSSYTKRGKYFGGWCCKGRSFSLFYFI